MLTCSIIILIFTHLCLAELQSNLKNGRIVGGQNTTIEEYPYQVSFEASGDHHCGGAIISELFIVTAAHCFYGTTLETITIRISSSYREHGGVVHSVKSTYTHPNYDSQTVDSDIAILKLDKPIQFSAGAQPIALPSRFERLPAGTTVTVSGWGHLRENGSSPDQLQVVQLPIVSQEDCAEAYDKQILDIMDNMLCAGYLDDTGRGVCGQDSGGPLVVDGKLYGVVSWSKGCAQAGFPSVYANVGYLRDFVTEVTGL